MTFPNDRRTFLKLAGSSVVLPALTTAAAAVTDPAHSTSTAASASSVQGLAQYVNPLQGTNSTARFSRGNTLPITAMPFGMAHWTLQSNDVEGWFFQPSENRVQGIRCTHQLSPWLGDYGYATFLPVTGEPSFEPGARASSYRPEDLHSAPHSLSLRLMRYRCNVDLSPTERCMLMEMTFATAVPQDSWSICRAMPPSLPRTHPPA